MSKVNDYEQMMEEIYTEKDQEAEYRQNQMDRLINENLSLRKKINILVGYLVIIGGVLLGNLLFIVSR